MSQKITITISDKLSDRLNAVKANINNVSALCQKAIEWEVYRQELILGAKLQQIKDKNTMEAIIERLKLEKQQYVERFRDQGYEEGYFDAQNMSYADLIEVIKGDEPISKTQLWQEWLGDKAKDIAEQDNEFDLDAWIQGWQEGIAAFWEEVKDQL